jgi:hypothetical protein
MLISGNSCENEFYENYYEDRVSPLFSLEAKRCEKVAKIGEAK